MNIKTGGNFCLCAYDKSAEADDEDRRPRSYSSEICKCQRISFSIVLVRLSSQAEDAAGLRAVLL